MELRWPSFKKFLEDQAANFGNRTAFSQFEGGQWKSSSYQEVLELSLARADSLIRSGHQPGDRVAVLANTSLELPIHFFGATLAGLINVPIDPKLSAPEILSILKHVKPRSLVVSTEFQKLGFELQVEAGLAKVLSLETVPEICSAPRENRERAIAETNAIYYTSGTLGSPKGVMISLGSILFELTELTRLNENNERDVIFSILPLNHLYGLTAGALYSMACGAEYVFAHSLKPQDIAFCLQEKKVTQLNVVPLLLNLLRRGILQKSQELPKFRRWLFALSLRVGPILPVELRRILFRPLHEKLGGHLRRSVSGAAPLDPATHRFFRAIGAPVYEGYGLTETGPVMSVNTTRREKFGTVGRPLKGVEVRIEAETPGEPGEILTRGPNLMQGYFLAPELTREAMSDGWFRTGDIGKFENGFLAITGRKKSLIVLESGKKIHAEEVEQAIGQSLFFQDNCVLGVKSENGELVVAVVHPTDSFLQSYGEQAEKIAVLEVQKLCKKLAPFKRPAFTILRSEAFPKTSSGKIKRHLITARLPSDLE